MNELNKLIKDKSITDGKHESSNGEALSYTKGDRLYPVSHFNPSATNRYNFQDQMRGIIDDNKNLSSGLDEDRKSKLIALNAFLSTSNNKNDIVINRALVDVLCKGQLAGGRTLNLQQLKSIVDDLDSFMSKNSVMLELNSKENKQRYISELIEGVRNDTTDITQGFHATCVASSAENRQAKLFPDNFVKEAVNLALYRRHRNEGNPNELVLPWNTNEILKKGSTLTYYDDAIGKEVTKVDPRSLVDRVVQAASGNINGNYDPKEDVSLLEFSNKRESGLYSKDSAKLLEAKSLGNVKYGLLYKESFGGDYDKYKDNLLKTFQSHLGLDGSDPKLQILSIDLGEAGRHSNHAMALEGIRTDANGKMVVILENTWARGSVIKSCEGLKLIDPVRNLYEMSFDDVAQKTNFFVAQVAKNGEYIVDTTGYWETHVEDEEQYRLNPESLKFVRAGIEDDSSKFKFEQDKKKEEEERSKSATSVVPDIRSDRSKFAVRIRNGKLVYAKEDSSVIEEGYPDKVRDLNAV